MHNPIKNKNRNQQRNCDHIISRERTTYMVNTETRVDIARRGKLTGTIGNAKIMDT